MGSPVSISSSMGFHERHNAWDIWILASPRGVEPLLPG